MLKKGIKTKLHQGHRSLLNNKTVSIIGNATDITENLLNNLAKDSQLFVCNHFAKADWKQTPQPFIYFLGDPDFGSVDVAHKDKDIAILPKLISIKYMYTPVFTSEGIMQGIDAIMKEIHGRILPINYLYANYRGGGKLGDFDYELQNGLQEYQNVLVLMLQAAIYMGAKNINLYGFKFSNILTYPLNKKRHHFFDEKEVWQWRGYKENTEISPSAQIIFFRDNYCTLMQLQKINEHAKKKGINITNYTPDSLLAIFDKKSSAKYV